MMCEGTTVTSCSSSVMQSESKVGLLDRSWLLRPLEKTLSPLPHGVWLLSTNWRSCAAMEGEEHVWRRGGGGNECRNRSVTVRSSSLCLPPNTHTHTPAATVVLQRHRQQSPGRPWQHPDDPGLLHKQLRRAHHAGTAQVGVTCSS